MNQFSSDDKDGFEYSGSIREFNHAAITTQNKVTQAISEVLE